MTEPSRPDFTVTAAPSRPARPDVRAFSVRRWIVANSVGLGLVYALFALFGDGVEVLFGVGHDSIVHDLAILAAFLLGGGVFVELRRRGLAGHTPRSTMAAVAAGGGLAIGFVVGFVIAGPPIDFALGALTLGTVGGALQVRILGEAVDRPGRLLAATVLAWCLAAVGVAVAAVLVGDKVDAAAGSGLAGFVAVTGLLGLMGGTIGGVVEGRALRRHVVASGATDLQRDPPISPGGHGDQGRSQP